MKSTLLFLAITIQILQIAISVLFIFSYCLAVTTEMLGNEGKFFLHYVYSFAKTGEPATNDSSAAKWESMAKGKYNVMRVGTKLQMEDDFKTSAIQ